MDNNTKVLWKLYGTRSKCYDKCYANEGKGRAAPNSCNPPATDPQTITCLGAVQSKAVTSIDKVCGPAGASPACGGSYPNGSMWAELMGIAVDQSIPWTYCGD